MSGSMRTPKIDSVRLVRRSDLEVVQVTHQGEPCLVLKDPIAANYIRMRPDEYFVLERLDGHRSLEQLQEAYKRTYPNQRITAQDIQSLLHRFHEQGLVLGEVAGQGEQLLQRLVRSSGKSGCLRFPTCCSCALGGIDPDRFLKIVSCRTSVGCFTRFFS
ncbi:MAG: PqqD family protein [Pirellulaceae bacterium]